MSFLYTLSIYLYVFLIRTASLFNGKARLWVRGRKNWEDRLKGRFASGDRILLFHCASLGEFEMARPLIEWVRSNRPEFKIVVSFFSPSGYEIRKDYQLADLVMYLPADTPAQAARFARLLRPEMVIFAKYEFWHHHIRALKKNGSRLIAISSVFRSGHRFFRWYGSMFRADLKCFEQLFVQDAESVRLLSSIEITAVLAGDTRFDRVFDQRTKAKSYPEIETFIAGRKVVIAGSSWQPEEKRLADVINSAQRKDVCWIIVPHDISPTHLEQIEHLLPGKTVRYSRLSSSCNESVLIIDNVGMLMSLYRYASIAIIGGGFTGKLHNILEPATFGCAVLFGPKHDRFREADEMIAAGGALEFDAHLDEQLNQLLNQPEKLEKIRSAASAYIENNLGACKKITESVF